jgi:hypothetical protein
LQGPASLQETTTHPSGLSISASESPIDLRKALWLALKIPWYLDLLGSEDGHLLTSTVPL